MSLICVFNRWTNSLEKRPSLWTVIEGIQRQEVWAADMVMKEDSLGVGVPGNQDKSKSRYKRKSQNREDLKDMCANVDSLPLNTYLYNIAGLFSDD